MRDARLHGLGLLGAGAAVAAATAVTACASSSSGVSGIGGAAGGGPSEWTILVYGHADHNLSNSLAKDIVEMAKAQLSPEVKVVVMADWDASATISGTAETFPTGVEWYEITGNGQRPLLVAREPEANLDSPAVLKTAITSAFSVYPAQRYGLILWDHGGAWDGGFGGDTDDGTNPAPQGMTVPDIASAVDSALKELGMSDPQPLDFFSFDTCLMGTAEVAYALRNLSKVYIANAEIDYGDGWDYEHTLTFLSQNLAVTPAVFGTNEVQLWDAHHRSAGLDDAALRAHGAFDPAKLGDLASATAGMVQAFQSSPDYATAIARAAYFAVPAYSAQFKQGENAPSYRDYGQLVAAMAADGSLGGVATEAGKVDQALKAATLATSRGELRQSQSALQLALPLATAIKGPAYLPAYAQRAKAWNDSSQWGTLLSTLAAQSDSVPPTVQTGLNAMTVNVVVADQDVAALQLDLLRQDAVNQNKFALFGLVTMGAASPGQGYGMTWNQNATTVGGQYASVFPWMNAGKDAAGNELPPVLAVIGEIADGGDSYAAYLTFRDGDAQVSSVVIELGGKEAAFALDAWFGLAPNATFTPWVAVIDGQTEEVTVAAGTPIAMVAGGLPIAAGKVNAGTYVLMTTAKDVWGNEGTSFDAVVVQ
jgi:hypothetical protein